MSDNSDGARNFTGLLNLSCCMHRLLSPLLLRQLLLWLEGNKAYGSKGGYSVGLGWLWAILLGTSGYLSTLTHHQAFWLAHCTSAYWKDYVQAIMQP